MSANSQPPSYGTGDATYQAAGGEAGIRQLVDDFYGIMSTNPRYKTIWQMHPAGNEVSRDKLARFLCAWMGGPRLFSEKYGPISIPKVHAHLPIGEAERDQWLACMGEALSKQKYPDDLVAYLKVQLAIPAGRVVLAANKISTD